MGEEWVGRGMGWERDGLVEGWVGRGMDIGYREGWVGRGMD